MNNSLNHPIVSVIIPAYNCERFIAAAIESVLSQTYKSLELIVIDDGSTDRTREIVQRFHEVVYIFQENKGPSGARNAGIIRAGGKYVAFLDSDDLWPAGKLKKQVDLMENNPEVALVFGDVQLFSENDILIPSMFGKRHLDAEFFGDLFFVRDAYRKLLRLNFIPTGSVMIRKRYLEQVGLFDEELRLAEDLDLWLRVSMHFPIGYCTDIWELKRDHEDNVSKHCEGISLSMIRILEKREKECQAFVGTERIMLSSRLCEVYRSLGYFYLNTMRMEDARRYLRQSLERRIQARTLIYWCATFLGTRFVKKIQDIRSKTGG